MVTRVSNLLRFYVSLAWRSVSDTSVYLRAALLPLKLLLTYTLLASLLIATAHAARYWLQDAPKLKETTNHIWQELVTTWPEDLVLEYAQGRWVMTPEEARTVPYPTGFEAPEGLPPNLATLLPVEPNTLSAPIPSLLAAGPTTFWLRTGNQNQPPEALPWTDLLPADQNILLNKEVVTQATPLVSDWIDIFVRELGFLVFLWRFLGVWLLRLLGLLIYAWLAQVFWTFRGRKLRYITVYKMGLLILPLAEILLLVWQTFWPEISAPLSFWWVWLVIMGVIVLAAPRK